MSPEAVGLIGIGILVVLLFSKMWVGISMLLVGFVGCIILGGYSAAAPILGMLPYTTTSNYTLACMPVFIFMGVLVSESGLGSDLYMAAKTWLGRLRGGLAMATIGACGFFAAVCGDSVTSAVTMSKVSYPEMMKHGYGKGLAAASIASGGTIGILIPPSLCFILYALITEQSVGKLFMAGIIPGILVVVFYMIVIAIKARGKSGEIPPAATEGYTLKEKFVSVRLVWPIVLVFLVMMAGMYAGFFTPTEAATVGVIVTIIVAVLGRRLTLKKFIGALKETLSYTCMIYILLIGAYVFMRFMAFSRIPAWLSANIGMLHTVYEVPRLIILLGVIVFYIFLGMFMDVLPCILLTLGFIYPIIETVGYNLIWFGVIMTRMMEIGMISPPFGINLFVCAKSCDVPMGALYRGIIPFVCASILHVALIVAVPALSLWLPSLM
ncbi:MAG: TRAP transporter large permease [Oscillospiraceae bacterium]|nr:TRAP transporter large permease [Oscillospiraceae bacterium]